MDLLLILYVFAIRLKQNCLSLSRNESNMAIQPSRNTFGRCQVKIKFLQLFCLRCLLVEGEHARNLSAAFLFSQSNAYQMRKSMRGSLFALTFGQI